MGRVRLFHPARDEGGAGHLSGHDSVRSQGCAGVHILEAGISLGGGRGLGAEIRYFSILRNEINSRQTAQIARGWQREGGGFGATADRAQRHTLALRDVAYIIRARPMVNEGVQEDPAKYRDQFRRRVKDGRCFATPYLGCREFSAWFSAPEGNEAPLEINEDLGNMLLRMDYLPGASGSAIPRFFHAELKGGVLKVPKASPEEA